MFTLGSLSITKRLGLLVGSALAGTLMMAAALLLSERSLILQERQDGVRQTVELAHGLVAQFYEQERSGKLPREEAQRRAMTALKGLRYSGSEYFWINDMRPAMVMHAVKPELDGKDLSENKDPNGKRLFVAFVDTVKSQGAGFVFYMWPKPGSDHPEEKVSYVKGFEPWGWVIGSGVYIDTVDTTVGKRLAGFATAALVLLMALAGMGLLVARSMLGQLGGEPDRAAGIARRIADGDLSVDIALKPGDQGSMLYAIRVMRDGLAELVARVRVGAESVASTTSQIARGNLDLSQRTEQQATALQQTAASMDELSATVRHNADSARHGAELAQGASAVAVQGGEEVGRVVDTMKAINDSSRQIFDIIGVIDGIAFQTNILALNAAVEAARAGEQGRGFAVVASEVRSLAGRSAEAAKQIKGLVNTSMERVEVGSAMVEQARVTMGEVVASIARVTAIVGEISSASAQQSQGVALVGEAVAQMDHATQQNAALVEQSAAAADSLQQQAQQLVQAVAVFKVGSGAQQR